MSRKSKGLATLLTTILAGGLSAATHEIANPFLTVRFDETAGSFTVSDHATGKIFLTNGRLDGTSLKADVKGQTITVTQTDGGATRLELKPDQPFLFVTRAIRNTTSATVDFAKVTPVSFSLDLGKPASELRTLGTGGLFEPDKNPGSYLFLTCVDPSARRNVARVWCFQT
jgi:hypothetical protein